MRSTNTYSGTGRRALLLGLWLVLIVSALLWLFGAEAVSAPAPSDAAAVVVKPGDTLWEIADRWAPPGVDLRVMVRELVEVNELQSKTLQPGQVLQIPFDST